MTLQWGDFPPQISLGKEKERDKTGGLGGHWVKASNFSGAPDGPTRSGIRFVFAVYKWLWWKKCMPNPIDSEIPRSYIRNLL